MYLDPNVPQILGAELLRPAPNCIAAAVTRPRYLYDPSKAPGDTYQFDRFKYWHDTDNTTYATDTLEARTRQATQPIGRASSRSLEKETVLMRYRRVTGPADPDNPAAPSTFKIPKDQLMTAQRNYWQYGAQSFHQSLGSDNMLMDYKRFTDLVYIQRMLSAPSSRWVDASFKATGSTVVFPTKDGVTNGGSHVVRVSAAAADQVVADFVSNSIPTFEDGTYGCLCNPTFLMHLRQAPDFREVARYPGNLTIPTEALIDTSGMPYAPPQIPYGNTPYINGLLTNQATPSPMGVNQMPLGFVYGGVRYFVSPNVPIETGLTRNFTSADPSYVTGSQTNRTAALGIFFGREALGMVMAGEGPQMLFDTNNDFGQLIIAIWQAILDVQLLNSSFVRVMRSFIS